MNHPAAMFQVVRDPDQGALRFALGALVVSLVAARMTAGTQTASLMAIAVLIGVPVMALRLYSFGGAFTLVAALAAWAAFRPAAGSAMPDLPVLLVRRLSYLAVPPLVLGMALADRDRERLRLGPLHLYGPAVAMALAATAHLFLRERTAAHEAEIQQPAAIYALVYAALIVVAMILRLQSAPAAATRKEGVQLARGEELEEQGRHALAARAYEREGQMDRAAESAERAGEWGRAGRLYKVGGNDFRAGEMFARAQMWKEALECYERSRSFAAAAQVCMKLGDVDRAAKIYEKAGDRTAVVRVLEEAGRRPTPEQYLKAGQAGRAAALAEEAGDWALAADLYENKLNDRAKAAEMLLRAGSFLKAGRLLEAVGRKQEALEAYAAVPEGAIDGARLCLAAGQPRQAAELIARVPIAKLEEMEDEAPLVVAAQVMLESGRSDDAVKILQGMKRRGSATGPVRMLLGRAFLDAGLVELAEEELRVATELPLDPAEELRASYLLGCVLEIRGRNEEALKVFHELMQKDLHYNDVQARYRRLKALGSGSAAG